MRAHEYTGLSSPYGYTTPDLLPRLNIKTTRLAARVSTIPLHPPKHEVHPDLRAKQGSGIVGALITRKVAEGLGRDTLTYIIYVALHLR